MQIPEGGPTLRYVTLTLDPDTEEVGYTHDGSTFYEAFGLVTVVHRAMSAMVNKTVRELVDADADADPDE